MNPKIPNNTAKTIYGSIAVINMISLNIIIRPGYLLETNCYYSVFLVTFVDPENWILIISY